MRPYEFLKIEESPDAADIRYWGLKSSAGRLRGNHHSYTRSASSRKAARRYHKRRDKAKALREERRSRFDQFDPAEC